MMFYLFIVSTIHEARNAPFIISPTSAECGFSLQADLKLHIRETHKGLSESCYQVVIISVLYAADHSPQSEHISNLPWDVSSCQVIHNIEAWSDYLKYIYTEIHALAFIWTKEEVENT